MQKAKCLTIRKSIMRRLTMPEAVDDAEAGGPAAKAAPDLAHVKVKQLVRGKAKDCFSFYAGSTILPDGNRSFQFRVNGPHQCYLGKTHRGSNNFTVIQGCTGDFQELSYNCCGSSCCGNKPKLLGRLTIAGALEQAGGGAFGPKDQQPSSLSKLAARFSEPFMLSNVSKSDFGSALILSKLFEHDRRVVYDSERFGTWDGTSWVASDTEAALLKTSFMYHMGRVRYFWCNRLERDAAERVQPLTTCRDNALNELQSRAPQSADKSEKDVLKAIEKAEKAIMADFNMVMKKIPKPMWRGAEVESVPIAHRCLIPLKVNLRVRDFASLLNANRNYLNTTCGAIDLRTGELLAHHPSNMLSKEIGTLYEGPRYPSPLIDQFMAEVQSEDIVPVMQMTLGYGITKHSKEKQFVVMHGPTNNAKIKLVTMVRECTGPYCVLMARDYVIGAGQHSKGAATPHLLMLDGAHIAVLEETEDLDIYNGASVNAIASGDGSMTVRGLHKDPVEVTMRCLLIICTNSLPKFNAGDTGTLNKLRIFPFQHEFVENPRPGTNQRLRDTDLMDKIKTPEWRKQMLAWLVHGSMKWYERGTLPTVEELPPAMSKALETCSNDNDHFGNFIMDRCVIQPSKRCHVKPLKEAYEMYMGKLQRPLIENDFKTLMRQLIPNGVVYSLGVKIDRINTTGYRGIGLLDPIQEAWDLEEQQRAAARDEQVARGS
jgi:P4 family phage/plasmid primase-like protien